MGDSEGALILFLFAAGLMALSMLGGDPGTYDLAWRLALCGAGFGFFQAPNNRIILLTAPRHRSGAAGGMLATARLLGQTAGAAAVAAAFHWLGVGSGPLLLRIAAFAAALAAAFSLLRLRVSAPS